MIHNQNIKFDIDISNADKTLNQFKELLDYDHESGVFTWKVKSPPFVSVGSIAGTNHSNGYLHIAIKGKKYLAHRLAWLFYYGYWPNYQVDHINGIKNDNRIENLRDILPVENRQNLKRANKNNKSTGVLGVTVCKKSKKYVSQINTDGKNRRIGCYKTIDEAKDAYLSEKRKHHKGNTL